MFIFFCSRIISISEFDHGSKIGKQSPSILLNVDMRWFAHIRLGERGHGNHFSKPFGIGTQPYQVSNMNHTLSNFPSNFIYWLVCQVCCYAGARIILLFFFLGLSCTKSCFAPMRFFFSAVCRVPNRAPVHAFSFPPACRARNRAPAHQIMPPRAFFHGLSCIRLHQIVLQCTKSCFNACFFFFFAVLSCTKSCCMVSIMLKVHHALVIILFVL